MVCKVEDMGTDPWMISERSCSRPVCTALMSTFLRQAFLPLREGCFETIRVW